MSNAPINPLDDRYLTLPHALLDIAAAHGNAISKDTLLCAMGTPVMPVRALSEPEPANWCCYARDAFLIPSAHLFGMTIREIHPPKAARGLEATHEFHQHFDASYRPLIQNALDHDQPVLAWRGWPAPHELAWGIITAPADNPDVPGRFEGKVFTRQDLSVTLPLEQPPVQLYVVEKTEPAEPDPGQLAELITRHASLIMANKLQEAFGVITGEGLLDPISPQPSPETPPR